MGQSCVELLLPMAKLVKGLATGAVLRIVTDDPAAREDLGAWCSMTGNELAFVDRKVGYATYYVRRGALS
ncbi:MAG: sulfurtransferase TusA family protein [Myxococcales bacterium]|nr:sulfurtransferase TusA family protein [Myxococcales bacterium]